MIAFTCALCGQHLHVADDLAGKFARCPKCGQIASIPAMIMLPYGWAGYGIYQGMNFLIPMTFLKFSRDAEREADFLGLQYVYKTGYDPAAFVDLFERLESLEHRKPRAITRLVSTHPSTRSRCRAMPLSGIVEPTTCLLCEDRRCFASMNDLANQAAGPRKMQAVLRLDLIQ